MTPHSPGTGRGLRSTSLEHEEDRGGGHVAEVAQDCPRAAPALDSSRSSSTRARSSTRRPAECSTQWRTSSRLSPWLSSSVRRHLGHHPGADAPHVLGEDHARPAARVLEAHGVEVLGAEQGAVLDDRRPAAGADERERPRAVGEDGVGHRALQPVVEEVGRRADLDGEHERAVTGERRGCDCTPAAARPPRRRSRCRRRARAARRGGSRGARPGGRRGSASSGPCTWWWRGSRRLPAASPRDRGRSAAPPRRARGRRGGSDRSARRPTRRDGSARGRCRGVGRRYRWLRRSRDGARRRSRPVASSSACVKRWVGVAVAAAAILGNSIRSPLIHRRVLECGHF